MVIVGAHPDSLSDTHSCLIVVHAWLPCLHQAQHSAGNRIEMRDDERERLCQATKPPKCTSRMFAVCRAAAAGQSQQLVSCEIDLICASLPSPRPRTRRSRAVPTKIKCGGGWWPGRCSLPLLVAGALSGSLFARDVASGNQRQSYVYSFTIFHSFSTKQLVFSIIFTHNFDIVLFQRALKSKLTDRCNEGSLMQPTFRERCAGTQELMWCSETPQLAT
jgi:hypothetical protein